MTTSDTHRSSQLLPGGNNAGDLLITYEVTIGLKSEAYNIPVILMTVLVDAGAGNFYRDSCVVGMGGYPAVYPAYQGSHLEHRIEPSYEQAAASLHDRLHAFVASRTKFLAEGAGSAASTFMRWYP